MAVLTAKVMDYTSDGSISMENPALLGAKIPTLTESSSVVAKTCTCLHDDMEALANMWMGDFLTGYRNIEANLMQKFTLSCDVTNNVAGNVQSFINADVEKDLESALAASMGGIA